jgi:hypothetical protein
VPPAAGPTLGGTLCKLSDITVGGGGASGCKGWYEGNLNGGSLEMNTDAAVALNALLNVQTYTAGGLSSFQNFTAIGPTVDFGTPLYGETIVSFHVGGAKGSKTVPAVGYESTAFYEFDAGDLVGGLASISFNLAGLSNAELWSTGSYQPPPPCTTNCGPPPCTEHCGPPPCIIDCGPPPCTENCGPPPCIENCGPPPCTFECGPPPCTDLCGGGGHQPGVPEPATWALMILGFGGAGAMLRRRRALLA